MCNGLHLHVLKSYSPLLKHCSHPGDHTDTETYNNHCPEAAPPVITALGTVGESGGNINNGATLFHYNLDITVYVPSTRSQVTFPLRIYFKNGKRWVRFPPLSPQSLIFFTGHLCGLTKITRQLAVLVNDIYFFPGAPKAPPSTPQRQDGAGSLKEIRDRWTRRVGMGESSKKRRTTSDLPHVISENEDTETVS